MSDPRLDIDNLDEREAARRDLDYVCPIDRGRLTPDADTLRCERCATEFPVVRGVPVLINDDNSVFHRADFVSEDRAYQGASSYAGAADKSSGLRRLYRRAVRRLSEADVPDDGRMKAILQDLGADPTLRVLIIGAGERASGPNAIRTDVAFAAGVDCICDAHDLPFEDAVFDIVYAEAVLEHVCDPQRCVSEITRVLRRGGRVFAVTPFLQPVHMGAYDFTRFTHLGHRRLFRMYDEIGSGMCGGPAFSAVHLFRTSIAGVSDNPRISALLRLAALVLTFPLRWLDPLFSRSRSGYDAGCAFYFCGIRRDTPIPDRDILQFFRGA